MSTVNDIRAYFENRVPNYMKLDFDNVGHLVGRGGTEVKRAVVALDVADSVIFEAKELGAQLILSHHPLFFQLKNVTDGDRIGRKVVSLIENGMSAICLHTNLDTVSGGVNDALMQALGARVTGLLDPHGVSPEGVPFGISRVGELDSEMDFGEFLARTKQVLCANGLRYHDAGRRVRKLGCCGGSGGGDIEKALEAGCDTFVTADVKYDQFMAAADWGINLIDAGHFNTENVVVPVLANMLRENFPDVEVFVSRNHGQTERYFS